MPWDLTAAALWGAGSALFGYVMAHDYEWVLKAADRFSIAIGIAAALAIAFWLWRHGSSGSDLTASSRQMMSERDELSRRQLPVLSFEGLAAMTDN